MRTVGILKFVLVGVLMAAVIGVGVGGCGSGASTVPRGSSPTINSLSPTTTTAGGVAFTLTVSGSSLVSSSVVRWNGSDRPTTFVSGNQLTAQISASDIAATGTAAVAVFNPGSGGGTSNTANFNISSATNSIPTISSLNSTCAPVGAQAFTLVVTGTNLVPNSVVRWNGTALSTTLNGGPPSFSFFWLQAQVPASDIATPGTAAVTVFNPPPGGGVSNSATFNIAEGGVGPQSIAVDPTGKFAYVANLGCPDGFNGNVSMYTINQINGTLTSAGAPVPAGDLGADSVSVDPSGKFAYVASSGEDGTTGDVSAYTINTTTGTLTPTGTISAPCAPPPSPGSCAPYSVAVHPSGKFAYVANEGGFTPTSVSMYAINGTAGDLALIGTIAADGRAVSVAVHPSGKFAYVADGEENTDGSKGVNISMYTIDAATGVLTSTGIIAAGISPSGVAIHPTGKSAYVTNSGSNDVSMYTIDATTGALTSLGPISTGTRPTSMAVDSTGKFAYVTNSGSNDVSMYTIDATTGALTSIGSVAAGSGPSSIAIHPSGKFAYVTNFGSNDISMYSIDAATGTLTLIGTIGS